jgi:hypothetical protein
MSHKFNILIAYPYLKKPCIDEIKDLSDSRVIIDSGAFTAWKAGKVIDINEYCSFIKNLPFEPWKYFMLDVIGDPIKTKKNYDIMLRQGLNPIPIFTRGDDIKELDEYYKTSDIVGIGGLVGTKQNKGFVKGIMEKVKGRKVHWLGFANSKYISYYKPYMCDSSSWASPLQFKSLNIYYGKGIFKTISKIDCIKKPTKEIIDLLEWYGEDYKLLQFEKQWVNSGRNESILERATTKSYSLFQYDIHKNFNTKYFLAISNLVDLKRLYKGFKFWKSKGVIKI